MMLYDRYLSRNVSGKELPDRIDFGRYYVIETGNDITYSNYPLTNSVIKQDLLLAKNKSIQDILLDIRFDVKTSKSNKFSVIPLIRRIKNKLNPNNFEYLLIEKLFHIEEIFRSPHYLLSREIEKVHVSRAKRIPTKSYQYLASHTEDWEHKSIINFKPSRILNEELNLNFDIYENQVLVVLIQQCIKYLTSRLKEIQDIRLFLSDYEKLLENRKDEKSWYKKTERNLGLIGSVYEDENYSNSSQDGLTLSETEQNLIKIQKRLLLLQQTELYSLVNKKVLQNLSVRNTNALVNHKHYRYVPILWNELIKASSISTQKNEEEKKLKEEQDILNGLRQYAKATLVYALKNTLNYKLRGNYQEFTGKHSFYDEIFFTECKDGTFNLRVGEYVKKIVIIANKPEIDTDTYQELKRTNTTIFYFSENVLTETSQQFICINPLDADSVERIASYIKMYLVLLLRGRVFYEYGFKPLLKEYVKYIPNDFVHFNLPNYSYKLHSFPKLKLIISEVLKQVENDINFKKSSRPRREEILREISSLVDEINENAQSAKTKHIRCFNCGEPFQQYDVAKLNYIKCEKCNSLFDHTSEGIVILKIDNHLYNSLSPIEFGVDYTYIALNEI